MSRNGHKGHKGSDVATSNGRAGVGQALTIEEACHAVNSINDRIKRQKNSMDERYAKERAKITLSPSLDAWLKKPVP